MVSVELRPGQRLKLEEHLTVSDAWAKAAEELGISKASASTRVALRRAGARDLPDGVLLDMQMALGSVGVEGLEVLVRSETNVVENNFLNQLRVESFEQIREATHIFLKRRPVHTIPDSFKMVSSLEVLDLFKVELRSLPSSLGELSQLRLIKLRSNCLSFLPEGIGKLLRLKHLDLSDNQLTQLPVELGELAALEYCHLAKNSLHSLPHSIGNLSALKTLEAGDNMLVNLPSSFTRLSSLRHLELQRNRLFSLPSAFGQLTALEHLDLSDNKLAAVSESNGLGQLLELRRLDLSGNGLRWMPKLGQLSKLRFLDLSHNELSIGPEHFEQLPALRNLYLTLSIPSRPTPNTPAPSAKVKLKFDVALKIFVVRRYCAQCIAWLCSPHATSPDGHKPVI